MKVIKWRDCNGKITKAVLIESPSKGYLSREAYYQVKHNITAFIKEGDVVLGSRIFRKP